MRSTCSIINRFILLCILLGNGLVTVAQKNILDSLEQLMKNESKPIKRIDLMAEICRQKGIQTPKELHDCAIEINRAATKEHYPNGIALSNNLLAKYYLNNGLNDSAIYMAQKNVVAQKDIDPRRIF